MTAGRRTLLLLGLLGTCASLVAWDRLRTPSIEVTEAVVRSSTRGSSDAPAAELQVATLRERGDYLAKGQDAFPSLLPPPPPKPVGFVATAPVEVPRQTAPPIPFSFIGKKIEGETSEVYLARGDQTYIAVQGGDLASDYRVEAIGPTNITLIYLPLNAKQTLHTGAPLHE